MFLFGVKKKKKGTRKTVPRLSQLSVRSGLLLAPKYRFREESDTTGPKERDYFCFNCPNREGPYV